MKKHKRNRFTVLPVLAVILGIVLYPVSAAALSAEPPNAAAPADTAADNHAAVPATDNQDGPEPDGGGTGGSGTNAGADVPDLFNGGTDTDGTGGTETGGSAATAGGAFTPPGSGTLVDNATDADGKEFYTVESADGSVFYLIIDRQRGTQNVYFLNAVTKDDLLPLAEDSESPLAGIIQPEPEEAAATPAAIEDEDAPKDKEDPPGKENGIPGTYIFVILAAVIAAGAGYYLKIYRPKKAASAIDSGLYDDESEYGTDYSYEDEVYPDGYENVFFAEDETAVSENDIAGEENEDTP